MTIDEAIADLSSQRDTKKRAGYQRQANAAQLGIEGLKAWKKQREGLEPGEYELLPGEDPE